MTAFLLFFKLMMGHAIGDFVLQPGPMSSGKNRNNDLRQQYGPEFPHWYYWLTAHSLTHAAIVFLITNSYLFAFLEAVSHWWIDYSKCENWINLHQDQLIHIAFKVLFCVLMFYGIS